MAVDATPKVVSQGIGAIPTKVEVEVMASPTMVLQEVDTIVEMVSKTMDVVQEVSETMDTNSDDDCPSQLAQALTVMTPPKEAHYIPQMYLPLIIGSTISLAWRTVLFGLSFITVHMQHDTRCLGHDT